MANERTEILYGPRAEIHTIKTGKIKHTLRYVGNNHYVTTPSSEKHDVQRTHYSLDDALDHLRKQGHQISKTDLHPSNKTPIVKESNTKDFKDFVKTTYAGLMEVEGLNESTSHDQDISTHPFFQKHFKDAVGGINKNPYTDDSGYTYKASYRKQGQHKRIYHTLKHLVNTKEGTHSVQLETRQKDFPLPIRSGDGDGKTVHEAMNNAIKNYKSDNWKPRAEKLEEVNINQFNLKDNVSLVKNMLQEMEVEGLNEARKILPITDAIKNHPDTESKLGLSSRVSNDQRKTKTYTTHSMSFYTHHPKLNYVRIEHVHQPSSKYSTGEHHVVHITGFPKEELPSRPDGAGTALYGGGEGGTAHEAYDKAIKAFDPNAR